MKEWLCFEPKTIPPVEKGDSSRIFYQLFEIPKSELSMGHGVMKMFKIFAIFTVQGMVFFD